MSSEHVEVLREMKGWRMPPIGGSAYNAALDAAIASLSAPQPPAEAQQCTCPSGDGSLRWPCPAHPPEAQAALSCVTVEIDADTGKITGTRREPLFTRPAEAQPVAGKLLSEGGAGCHDCDGYQAEGVFCPTCGTDHSAQQPAAVDGAIDAALRFLGGLQAVGNAKAGEIARGLRALAAEQEGVE